MDRLNILYRGPLSSCNYDCHYCPFAKRRESTSELANDREQLHRFVDWLKARTHRPHGLFFTPWGEALTRRWYRDAIVKLSHFDHMDRIAIQTNLSATMDWLCAARVDRVALWCTYHPDEVERAKFLKQCEKLDRLGVRYSVGVVGVAKHMAEIEILRAELPEHVYLWVNAYKSSKEAYGQEQQDFFSKIDPLFPINNTYHASAGKPCDTGLTTVSIDGAGDVRRCHFVRDVLGNIYQSELESMLRPRLCSKSSCGCHIGYVHMPSTKLKEVFGANILERIPIRSQVSNSAAWR
jgi:MoaA/NifB/PqqE/SkfB family radical SAM enzyme